LDYNPFTGLFTWRISIGGNSRKGAVAGAISHGYISIGVDGVRYLAHRLAWFYVHGKMLEGEIDHRNRDRTDNRIENLRPANVFENRQNVTARSDSKSGIRGVSFDPRRQKWVAQITAEGTHRFLGYFTSMGDAAHARSEAERRYFKEFAPRAA
jgi:hypothetical protein